MKGAPRVHRTITGTQRGLCGPCRTRVPAESVPSGQNVDAKKLPSSSCRLALHQLIKDDSNTSTLCTVHVSRVESGTVLTLFRFAVFVSNYPDRIRHKSAPNGRRAARGSGHICVFCF